ncbi:MAG: hypothetical protein M3Z14_07505 [Candidatus Eremiobacteraeota bacterium]|nr:hypothetical protein [Candidatus Eremiobacteraeota bacterium]
MIVALFVVLGALAILHLIEALFMRRIEINFGALLLPIGIGLARRKAFAYRCAVAALGLLIALSALVLVAVPWLNADAWFNG